MGIKGIATGLSAIDSIQGLLEVDGVCVIRRHVSSHTSADQERVPNPGGNDLDARAEATHG